MTTFLSSICLLSGILGVYFLLAGPAAFGGVWLILALISLVSVPVLNYLERLVLAVEKREG